LSVPLEFQLLVSQQNQLSLEILQVKFLIEALTLTTNPVDSQSVFPLQNRFFLLAISAHLEKEKIDPASLLGSTQKYRKREVFFTEIFFCV
jgi:hypothetical protein